MDNDPNMVLSIPRLEDYGISSSHGFLPQKSPLVRLDNPHFAELESIMDRLHELISCEKLEEAVHSMSLVSLDYLKSDEELMRAYVTLAFLTHAYMWSGDKPSEIIPPPLSVPFLEICQHFELPPVATYAGVVLWNWKSEVEDKPPVDPLGFTMSHTFTGSSDESWFYSISVAIEAQAAPTLPLMLRAFSMVHRSDCLRVTECLREFSDRVRELKLLLIRMYERCNPSFFFNHIRPFLAGSAGSADAGLPRGIIFDIGSAPRNHVQYRGGSNAQSSLMQFFDLALGVKHHSQGQKAASGQNEQQKESTIPRDSPGNFIIEMRQYMPGPHRRFLEHVASVANIAEFVILHKSDQDLSAAYNTCLAEITSFRSEHLRMVSRYIVAQSSRRDPSEDSMAVDKASLEESDGQIAEDAGSNDEKTLRVEGTGGTDVIPFLKQVRDETLKLIIQQ